MHKLQTESTTLNNNKIIVIENFVSKNSDQLAVLYLYGVADTRSLVYCSSMRAQKSRKKA